MTLAAQEVCLNGRLRGVTATLRPGEVTAICGPNGAGKSSLLAALAGLVAPDSGVVSLDGAPLDAVPAIERAKSIGYLPQAPEIAWDMAVETLVSLGRLPWPHAAPGEAHDSVAAALAAMELEGLRQSPLSRLSGGERARVLIARVLATCPRWLLADEPLANLDLAHAARLMALLRSQANMGMGTVLVLHDLATARNHADRVLVIDEGLVIADAPPASALDADVIRQVWNVAATWVDTGGRYALCVG